MPSFQMFGGCDLHIPHKKWANNLPNGGQEEANLEAIEQWAQRLKDCGGACSCWAAQYQNTITVADSAVSHMDRSAFTLLASSCGTINTSAITHVTVNLQWGLSATTPAVYDSWIITSPGGESGATEFYGQTVVPSNFKNAKASYTRIFPSGIWGSGLSTAWTIYFQQNTGSDTTCVVNVHEYQPCCDCNWNLASC